MSHWTHGLFVFLLAVLIAPTTQAAFVNTSTLNCRAAPNTEAEILKTLARGDQVVVLESADGWARSQINETISCWVFEGFLTDSLASQPTFDDFADQFPQTIPDQAATQEASEPLWVPKPRSPTTASSTPRRTSSSTSTRRSSIRSAPVRRPDTGGSCPCTSSRICVGPRGGRYCLNSTGSKRYGV